MSNPSATYKCTQCGSWIDARTGQCAAEARNRERDQLRETVERLNKFWVIEQFTDGKSQGYWFGNSSRDFSTDIGRAIQFRRKEDASKIMLSWHWKDTQVTEHMYIDTSIAQPTELEQQLAAAGARNRELEAENRGLKVACELLQHPDAPYKVHEVIRERGQLREQLEYTNKCRLEAEQGMSGYAEQCKELREQRDKLRELLESAVNGFYLGWDDTEWIERALAAIKATALPGTQSEEGEK